MPKNPRVNKPTNSDRIRSMSDEELAQFLLTYITCDKDEILCNPAEYKYSGKCNGRCIENRLDWLRQPSETEAT